MKFHLIPILNDNYVFALINPANKNCIVVDPGSADEVIQYLDLQNLQLDAILLTHHHADHIGGCLKLQTQTHCKIFAPRAAAEQITFATSYLEDGSKFQIGDFHFHALATPGHTLNHMIYFETTQHWAFVGDLVFGLGCGRLFEGSFEQGFRSLEKLKQLPADTLLFCAHEYTRQNILFCQSPQMAEFAKSKPELQPYFLEYEKKMKTQQSSVPLLLSQELLCNPFLSSGLENFIKYRTLRNSF